MLQRGSPRKWGSMQEDARGEWKLLGCEAVRVTQNPSVVRGTSTSLPF